MRNRLLAMAALAAAFLAMVALTKEQLLTGLDLKVTETLQMIIPRGLDLPFSLFSLLGSSEVVAVIMLVIAGFVFIKFNRIFWGLGAMAFIYVVEILGKFLLYHPGPPKEFFRYAIPFAFPQYVATNYSFPSGHVSRTFFLVVIGVFLINKLNLNKKYKIILFTLSVIMIISRIYLGEHWFSDTVGGIFLGTAMGMVATFAF